MKLNEPLEITDLALTSGNVLISPEEELKQAMVNAGIGIFTPPNHIEFDGKFHRFPVEGDDRKKINGAAGWYNVTSDLLASYGTFGNFRTIGTDKKYWVSKSLFCLSQEKQNEFYIAYQQKKHEEAEKQKELEKRAIKNVHLTWASLIPATDEHPYLVRKKVKAHGLRMTDEKHPQLVVPLYIGGELSSLQYISENGDKMFFKNAPVSEAYYILKREDNRRNTEFVYICEGYATGASIHEALGCDTIIALNAGNLPNVASVVKDLYPNLESKNIVFVADNDIPQNGETMGVGEKYAKMAAEKIGAEVKLIPRIGWDANDFACAGRDLRKFLTPNDYIFHGRKFRTKTPPRWLIKHYVKRGGSQMLWGPSGVGKSFVELSKALYIATPKLKYWFGHKIIRHGAVVYLAGEGYEGMERRLNGLQEYLETAHNDGKNSNPAINWGKDEWELYFCAHAVDLDKPNDLKFVMNWIDKKVPTNPVLIIVDTLNCFQSGNENNSQDVHSITNAMNKLQQAYDCTVELVHHSGKSKEVSGPRGSSAFAASMDIMLEVKEDESRKDSTTDGKAILLVNSKNKEGKLDKEGEPFKLAYYEFPDYPRDDEDDDDEPVTTCYLLYNDAEQNGGKAEKKKDNKALNQEEHQRLTHFRDILTRCGNTFGFGIEGKATLLNEDGKPLEEKENIKLQGRRGVESEILKQEWGYACSDKDDKKERGKKATAFHRAKRTLMEKKRIQEAAVKLNGKWQTFYFLYGEEEMFDNLT